MCLANNIRFLRKKKGLLQEQIADMLGYKSYTTIQKWEMGISEPPVSKLRDLAKILGADINDMTSRDLSKSEPKDVAYYLNDDARDAAQFLFDNPEYKVLFDASRKVKKEDIEFVKKMIDKMSE